MRTYDAIKLIETYESAKMTGMSKREFVQKHILAVDPTHFKLVTLTGYKAEIQEQIDIINDYEHAKMNRITKDEFFSEHPALT